jgi:hypothetical protein
MLWVHVLAGVTWVGACGSFVLAAAALAGGRGELHDFAVRSVPRLNRLCLGCAGLIPLTGLANLAFAAHERGGVLPREFVAVVGVKIGLFATMACALWLVVARESALEAWTGAGTGEAVALGGLLRLYGLIAVLGAAALVLGLWLAGI